MVKKQTKKEKISLTPTESVLESISDGVFSVDENWRITSFNRAAEEITSIPREEAIGELCSEVFRSSMCEKECALKETLKTEKPIINKNCYIVNGEGKRIPISVSTAVLRDNKGKIIGGAETFRDLSDVEELRKQLEGKFRVGDVISHSPVMRKVFDLVRAVAASGSTVLIQGDTGTGKELIARAIFGMSPRANKPFVAVNCGALPDTLLESELFGYKKGAFTGANQDKPGRFALAKDGTIFLDEIGEISMALQVRLLRVLQEKTYEPLGCTKSVKTHARVITATNKNLAELVKKGSFREDLYYRINVIRIDIPPLRFRKEDIPLLIDHFVERFNRLNNRKIKGVTPEGLSFLMAHDWPGNVRELENIIERAFILCPDLWIKAKHLPGELTGSFSIENLPTDIKTMKNMAEKHTILSALKKNENNIIKTAKDLKIHKTTLYRKIENLGIILPSK